MRSCRITYVLRSYTPRYQKHRFGSRYSVRSYLRFLVFLEEDRTTKRRDEGNKKEKEKEEKENNSLHRPETDRTEAA